MHIHDFLNKEAVLVDLKSQNKQSILKELSEPVSRSSGIDHNDILKVLMEREHLGSTGIGNGIGIPHGKLKALKSMVLAFGLSRKGVDFESMDGHPAHIFFLLLTPENSAGLHLKLLAHISRILKDDSFRKRLMNVSDSDEVISIIKEEEGTF